MSKKFLVLIAVALAAGVSAAQESGLIVDAQKPRRTGTPVEIAKVPPEWLTPSEKNDYRTTPRYDETMAYLRRVQKAAPRQVRIESFGKTGMGRDLWVVIASRDGQFDPAALHKAGRPIVLFQNSIHAGEMDGKDASLALLRDMVITKTQAELLERAVFMFIPFYNADGHERMSPYNRINQNGPEQMGWRTNATNLNLNRDYMKLDTPEARALLKLWTRWLPDFFVDNHVTDGADYQYDTTWGIPTGPDVFPAIAQWVSEAVIPHMTDEVTRAGHVIGPYVNFADPQDVAAGVVSGQDTPRYSTGYFNLHNRPSMLVEMHMLKDYKTRVLGNYHLMRAVMEVVNRDAARLMMANRGADDAASRLGSTTEKFPIRLRAGKEADPLNFRGYEYTQSLSEVSGGIWVKYTDKEFEREIPWRRKLEVTRSVTPPAAYLVPGQWTDVIAVLEAHGLKMQRLTSAWSGEVETYRCENMKWQERPFEGRHMVQWGDLVTDEGEGVNESGPHCHAISAKLEFPAGSVLIPLNQRASKVAIHFLEPMAPDSAVTWGFFDPIFEQKEYAESYVLEKLARLMMEKDPKLREEFQKKVETDPSFARDRRARLNFFYQRSPWWDDRIGVYPVGRLKSFSGLPISR